MRTLKAIIGGALLGAGLFFIPFIFLRVFLFLFIVGAIFRFSGGRRRGWGGPGFGGRNRFAFVEYVRDMSDDEYNRFRQHFGNDFRCNDRPGFGRKSTETTNENL